MCYWTMPIARATSQRPARRNLSCPAASSGAVLRSAEVCSVDGQKAKYRRSCAHQPRGSCWRSTPASAGHCRARKSDLSTAAVSRRPAGTSDPQLVGTSLCHLRITSPVTALWVRSMGRLRRALQAAALPPVSSWLAMSGSTAFCYLQQCTVWSRTVGLNKSSSST